MCVCAALITLVFEILYGFLSWVWLVVAIAFPIFWWAISSFVMRKVQRWPLSDKAKLELKSAAHQRRQEINKLLMKLGRRDALGEESVVIDDTANNPFNQPYAKICFGLKLIGELYNFEIYMNREDILKFALNSKVRGIFNGWDCVFTTLTEMIVAAKDSAVYDPMDRDSSRSGADIGRRNDGVGLRREEEEKIRNLKDIKQAKEIERRRFVYDWRKRKYKLVEEWFAMADVILDTNVWMDMEKDSEEVRADISPCMDWKKRVRVGAGSCLLEVLFSCIGSNAKVIVPGQQLDEINNITHKNSPGSPTWTAAQEAKNRILRLQKMGRVVITDVKARPDRWAYLDATLIDLVAKRKEGSSTLKPIRIVTFDRDLILRLRGVAAGCEHGKIEIIDKDDLIALLT